MGATDDVDVAMFLQDTAAHNERVGLLMARVGRGMGGDPGTMYRSGVLHDLGKTDPDVSAILSSSLKMGDEGAPTAAQFKWATTQHEPMGGDLVGNRFGPKVRETVAGHGGPLKGANSRSCVIAAACDQYDALRSARSYKPGMTHADAMNELYFDAWRNFGGQLDNPDVVRALNRLDGMGRYWDAIGRRYPGAFER